MRSVTAIPLGTQPRGPAAEAGVERGAERLHKLERRHRLMQCAIQTQTITSRMQRCIRVKTCRDSGLSAVRRQRVFLRSPRSLMQVMSVAS